MDKDDKKKMGDEKFEQYRRIRKILYGKNSQSRKLAKKVEEVIEGRRGEEDGEGSRSRSKSKTRSKSKSRSKSKRKSRSKDKSSKKKDTKRKDSKEEKKKEMKKQQDKAHKVRQAIAAIKNKLVENNEARK